MRLGVGHIFSTQNILIKLHFKYSVRRECGYTSKINPDPKYLTRNKHICLTPVITEPHWFTIMDEMFCMTKYAWCVYNWLHTWARVGGWNINNCLNTTMERAGLLSHAPKRTEQKKSKRSDWCPVGGHYASSEDSAGLERTPIRETVLWRSVGRYWS